MTTVRLEELDVAYHWAAVDGTRPIVVLHGWGASAAAVRSIVGAFGSERTVLAPDLPGFGASQRPEAVWGSEQYAQLICELLQYHAIREADVIGHSFGGKIGILLAANRPEVVRNLVLVNSAGIRPQRTFAYHARVASYKLAKSFIKDTARFGSADFQQAGAMRNILVRVVNEDVTPLLPSIRQRTLLVWGDQDSETPVSDGYTMERFIPNAGLVVFPGAGHFAYIDDAGRFARVVTAFLED